MRRKPSRTRRILALVATTAVAGACLPAGQRWEAVGPTWTAEVDDFSGTIDSVRAVPNPSPAGLAIDAIRVVNATTTTVQITWLGDPSFETAWFDLRGTRGRLELDFELGTPCVASDAVAYAVDVTLDQPVDAAAISLVPAGPP